MGALVECRSDWSYAQRPLAFQWEGQRRVIEEISATKRTPDGMRFVVRTNEGETFELSYDESTDQWEILFQAAKESA